MKFNELNLKPEIQKALQDMGYTDLTPIQEMTFPHVLAGRDLIARAETGSGKTAACSIPLVQNIDPDFKAIQALILVPTRELALQYVQAIADVARHSPVQPFAVYGGFSMQIQRAKLDHGVHVLVATPGRLIDLLYNTPLSLSEVRTFVLDEADEMLNMGFIDDVEFVLSCLTREHQTMLFSATMPQEIKRLSARHLKDPLTIELNIDQIAPQSLSHQFQLTDHHRHLDDLVEYLQSEKPAQAIIFCNSRQGGEKLCRQLRERVKSVDFIHGGLDQGRRTSLFNRFRNKEVRYMVATDVASRGLDFSHVSHVINYDFPRNSEIYTHRTGRTARMGRHGVAVTFYTQRDLRNLRYVIQDNHLEPVWIGPEPDLSKLGRKRHGQLFRSKAGSATGARPRGGKSRGGRNRGRQPKPSPPQGQ